MVLWHISSPTSVLCVVSETRVYIVYLFPRYRRNFEIPPRVYYHRCLAKPILRMVFWVKTTVVDINRRFKSTYIVSKTLQLKKITF